MASIMNSGDASSFGLANHFELGAKVQIDGQGKGTVLKYISSTTGDLCQVELDNTEFVITVPRWVALTESTGSNRLFRRLRDQQRSLREFYLFLQKVAFFPR